jgi:uncharacterized protein (TIGR03437 family)
MAPHAQAQGLPGFTLNTNNLTFITPTGQQPAPQAVAVNTTTGQSVQPTINAATITGGQWLTFSVTSNSTPLSINVQPSVAGLAPGTYFGNITIQAPGYLGAQVGVVLTVGSATGISITATPNTLSFAVQQGANSPPAQTVSITSNSTTPVNYTLAATTSNGGPWLLLSSTQGSTNSSVSVTVNPAGLAPGSYTGTITVNPTVSGIQSVTINIGLSVGAQPTLNVTPTSMSFQFQSGTTSLPPQQVLTLATTTGTANFAVSASTLAGGPWLVPSVTQGVASSTPQQIGVNVSPNIAGLPQGSYNGQITITAQGVSNTVVNIPVTLLISQNPILTVGNPPQPFNFTIGGQLPPVQNVPLSLSSGQLPYSISFSLPAGQNWLQAGPVTGTVPTTLSVQVNPTGLAPGQYTARIEVNVSGAANSPTSIPITLNVTAASQVNVNPGALNFNFQTNTNNNPPPQTIEITSPVTGTVFNAVSTTQNCGGTWLTSTPNGGSTPAFVQVGVNPAGIIAPATCQGRVTITPSGGNAIPVTVPVTLNVSATPLLNVSRASLAFTAIQGGTAPATQAIALTSTDGTTAIQYASFANTTTGGQWLAIQGSGVGSTPNNLTIGVNPGNLAPGFYEGSITLTSQNLPQPLVIPVSLTITSNVSIGASPTSLTFTQAQGGPAPPLQVLNITSSGASLTWSAVGTTNIGNWLTVTPISGTTPGQIQVSVNGSALSQGTYTGTVTINAPGSSNLAAQVPVTLTVGAAQALTASPTSLTFSYQAGTTVPPAQTVALSTTSGQVNFGATATTQSGGNWLSVSPTQGSAPGNLSVSISPQNLIAGTYNGTITVQPAITGAPSITIPVTITVTGPPPPSVTVVLNAASYQAGPVSPGELVFIGGTNIGPAQLTGLALTPQGTVATTLAETQVLFDGIAGPLVYVSNNQTVAIVPYEVAGRLSVTLTIRRAGITSPGIQLRLADAAPGLFTANSQGVGLVAALNQNFSAHSTSNPALRGTVIQLFGTGEGLVQPRTTGIITPATAPLPVLTLPVTATIGGRAVTVEYAGPAPGLVAGVFQVNLRIPNDMATGQQPVVINFGTNSTQGGVTIAVGQ